jgi:cytochrome c peroxidase
MRCWKATSAGLAGLWLACSTGGLAPSEPPTGLDPDRVQRGAMLFIDPRVSADQGRSCATCHPGGEADARVWARGVSVDPGAPGGRRTRSLRGAWQSAPYFWDASAPTLRAAIERMLQVEMGGAKLAAHDVEALETYLLSLTPFDRGRVQPDGTPTEPVSLAALRGWDVYRRARCTSCHPPAAYLVPRAADVGTGGMIDVPGLRGLAGRAPYGHDGRWATLEEAVLAMLRQQKLELSFDERLQLQEYLKLL